MWLLSTTDASLHLFDNPARVPGGYAILSHVWQPPELSFQDIMEKRHHSLASSASASKILWCAQAAKRLGYDWAWIDTCCINKTSSIELQEAINSMFKWYAAAAVCLAYMQDVPDNCYVEASHSSFRKSRWFTRGWTLQELIAPRQLMFMSVHWRCLGTKASLASLVEEITGINAEVLTMRRALRNVSIARRMLWASSRVTTKSEDEAYSLMGIFDVSMPAIYGEGPRAFQRLQEELMKHLADYTLFAWGPVMPKTAETWTSQTHRHKRDVVSSLLATSPSDFSGHTLARPPGLTSVGFDAVLEHARRCIDVGDVKQHRYAIVAGPHGAELLPKARGAFEDIYVDNSVASGSPLLHPWIVQLQSAEPRHVCVPTWVGAHLTQFGFEAVSWGGPPQPSQLVFGPIKKPPCTLTLENRRLSERIIVGFLYDARVQPYQVVENGSRTYGDQYRQAKLTATRWPKPDCYCVEIRLDGEVYTSIRATELKSNLASGSPPLDTVRMRQEGTYSMNGSLLQPTKDEAFRPSAWRTASAHQLPPSAKASATGFRHPDLRKPRSVGYITENGGVDPALRIPELREGRPRAQGRHIVSQPPEPDVLQASDSDSTNSTESNVICIMPPSPPPEEVERAPTSTQARGRSITGIPRMLALRLA
ncbi:hypothetical protein BN946_scf184298.g39 [Trametes cinnabarina]|uniref:Uncharacterized protein n=1 Tax=Pycnoporus cinnabarinus TaxID=5643 RepID=A0A060SR27_PYCCI|nr:hypothetical protein BN946_scf184298.g39 [Trametes cinnabarina]